MLALGPHCRFTRFTTAPALRRTLSCSLQRSRKTDGVVSPHHLRRARPRSMSKMPATEGSLPQPRASLLGSTSQEDAPSGHAAEGAGLGGFLGTPLLIGPADDGQAQALLVLAPGAFTPADAYEELAEALQTALNGRISLVIVILDIDWRAVNNDTVVTTLKFMKLAVEQAVEAAASHITLSKSRSGRYDKLFLAGHSVMGIGAVRYGLEKAAGTVLLGSAMLPEYSDLFPTTRTWTRPILQVSAELDGQQYLSKQAFSVLGAAESAARLGLRLAATLHPSIVMPGLNHASFAAGGTSPLDLQPDVDHVTAVQQIAELLADFLVVHCTDVDNNNLTAADAALRQRQIEDATDALVQRQLESADIVDPFLDALGHGHSAQALKALQAEPHMPNTQAALAAGMALGAFGGEVLREDEASRRWLAHPGELAAAEKFAVEVQQGAVPERFRDRVVVVATAHTDESTFLYNQPTIDPLPGGKVLVRVHVHLWRRVLETSDRNIFAVAPEYALKLRTASAICRALGKDEDAERQTVSNICGRKINEATFDKALGMVTPAVRQRYQDHGKQITFGEMPLDTSARAWVKRRRVIIKDTSERETQILAPTYNSQPDHEPVPKLDTGYSRGVGRFTGNHYVKGWRTEDLAEASAVAWLTEETSKVLDR